MRVTKVCENCGREYEGSPQSRFHSDSCRKAYARKADESLPERQLNEEPPELGRPLRVLLQLDPDAKLSELEEQVIRDHFGFSKSDKRTRAERAGQAKRIMEKAGPVGEKVTAAVAELQRREQTHRDRQEAWRAATVPSP